PPAKAYPTLDTRPLKESEYPARPATANEDILDLTDFGKDSKVPPKKSSDTKGEKPASAKPRLPNGNYACQHKCKDKTSCRHICCREGLPKPPPSPKPPKPKKPAEPPTLSSPIRSSQASKGRKASEKQRSQLDRVHDKANDGNSGIKQGSLVQPRDAPHDLGSTSQYVDYLLSSPGEPTALEDDAASSTSDELPEPFALSFGKKDTSVDSPDSYDDSEMDLWAANIPSEVLDVEDGSIFFPVSEQPQPAKQTSKPLTTPPRKKNKRANDLVEDSESTGYAAKRVRPSLVEPGGIIDLATPPRKQHMTETLPTPRSALPLRETHKPLFQPSSSPSASTIKQSESLPTMDGPLPSQPTMNGHNDMEEFLDSVFEGVKIVPRDKSSGTERSKSPDIPKRSSAAMKNTQTAITTVHPSSVKSQKQIYKPKETSQDRPKNSDPMAELNAWLEENGL
ncbi:Sec63, partial [Ceratobasidium sp. 428]